MTEEKFEVVVGHFSLYTLGSKEKRQAALVNLKTVMKPGGTIILVIPSVDYDARSIIDESVQLVRRRQGWLSSLFKQIFIYPFTKAIGLRFIQKQLREGEWKAFTRKELSQEIENAGFVIQNMEEVYAGSAFLLTGKIA